jgi:uncharacterized membrane protein HdeD (DUF308 family)
LARSGAYARENEQEALIMATTNPDIQRMQAAVAASLHQHWGLFLTEGIVLLVLGIIAILLPPLATLAVEIVIGWVLLLSGIVGLISSFKMRSAPGFWWSLFSALLGIVAGVVLLRWPLSGTISLTLILTIFLTLEGVASIMLAFTHSRGFSARWSLLLMSGLIDLILAGLIFFGLPGTAAWAIGLLVGINLVFGGIALISMALHARTTVPAATRPT